MLAGSFGIMIGAPIILLLFGPVLPHDAWKGIAALTGSWIGGSANMVAVAESVGTPDNLLGPMIIVDTVVGYSWMAVLLVLSAWQDRFDRWNHAHREAVDATNRHLATLDARRAPLDLRSAGLIVLGGFAAATLAVAVGGWLPELGNPKIISHMTWTVLLVVTVGLILSFTRLQRLEEEGASRIGYVALYLMMAAVGAQADLRAVLEAPVFLLAGVVWIAIHVTVLLNSGARIRRTSGARHPRRWWRACITRPWPPWGSSWRCSATSWARMVRWESPGSWGSSPPDPARPTALPETIWASRTSKLLNVRGGPCHAQSHAERQSCCTPAYSGPGRRPEPDPDLRRHLG